MKRGDLIIAAEKGRLSGKPRPWLVVQSDAFNETHGTLSVCMVSSTANNQSLFRVPLTPDAKNGLQEESQVMADVLLTIACRSIDRTIGHVDEQTMYAVDEALRRWLDL